MFALFKVQLGGVVNNDIYDIRQCTRAYIIYNLKKCDLPCIIFIELFFVFFNFCGFFVLACFYSLCFYVAVHI